MVLAQGAVMNERSNLWEKAFLLFAATPFLMVGLALLIPVALCVVCAGLYVVGLSVPIPTP